jgi:hypothetical protein
VARNACPALTALLDRYAQWPEVGALREHLDVLAAEAEGPLLDLYEQAVPVIEARLWAEGAPAEALAEYQALSRELEQQIGAAGPDRRHAFLVVIPVADRPLHLEACLESLLRLCEIYCYGGLRNGRHAKVSALVADDSQAPANIARHRALAAEFTRRGLETEYFGLEAQQWQLAVLDTDLHARLVPILGDPARGAEGHKGASRMRNLTYLRLAERVRQDPERLFWFVDSDQAFEVSVPGDQGDRALAAVNFLYHLDRIFRRTDTLLLTGKVVGDPPVSPAVMAANLLEDVLGFLGRMAHLAPDAPCRFHRGQTSTDGAAYHDMAELFGFAPVRRAFDYRCGLSGPHDHRACLYNFAARLDGFFDGEHPTRKIWYEHHDVEAGIKAARTVYTGNYVLRPEALAWFIPFAILGLRMAGPVLGRILKSEIGGRFVSANLPMRHGRTVQAISQSEFRPGVRREGRKVDLSGELERQFFGDIMLFTVERLTAQGFPLEPVPESGVRETLAEVEAQMLELYGRKRDGILDRLDLLRTRLGDCASWWTADPAAASARRDFQDFLDNMERNFGDRAEGYQRIRNAQNREAWRGRLLEAILGYRDARAAWEPILSR